MPDPQSTLTDPTQTQQVTTPDNANTSTTTQPPAAPSFSWKSKLSADYANSPTMKNYEDTPEGLNAAIRSQLDLTRMLGHEKVPVPKGPDDTAAWALFSKAMGIPEKPDGYALPDVEVPDALKGLSFDKAKFAEIVHQYKIPATAAKGLWDAYTEMNKQGYAKALAAQEDKVKSIVNELRKEWGDAYQSKVELGQLVINKFSENEEMNDFITAALVNDPRGIKFLSKLGEQFSENKIGDFKYQRHALTPEEAQRELDSIRNDPNHPYNNEKAPLAERERAIEHANSLIGITVRAKTR